MALDTLVIPFIIHWHGDPEPDLTGILDPVRVPFRFVPHRKTARSRDSGEPELPPMLVPQSKIQIGHEPNVAAELEEVADVTGFTKHGINRVIDRKIPPVAILDALNNPLRIVPQANGTTQYIGRDATVVLNPFGRVVTIWPQ
jgi:hypothetical protein